MEGARIGDYELVRLLGEGGMGAVHEARDPAGRSVAVKVVSSAAALEPEGRARFVREARATAAVSHRNVVRVHSAGEDRGRAFIVLELVAGGSLGKLLRDRGPLPWAQAVGFAIGVARGLEAIHAAGFVHRDLKPDNVLLDVDGTPKVSDLGLVTGAGVGSLAGLTKTGELLGTPAFMAPEQVDRAREVDARADVYALGATLFALLTGEPPFEGGGPSLVFAVLRTPPPRPSSRAAGIPPALDRLVLECLAKDPEKRPASAAEVARRLEEIARGGARRSRGLSVAAIAAALVIAGAAGLAVRSRAPSTSPTPTPSPSPSPSPSPTPTPEGLDPGRSLREASEALEREDAASAIAASTSAILGNPRLAAAYAVRAAARELAWQPALAIEDADRCLELGARGELRASACAARAAAEADRQDVARALEDLREARGATGRARALALAVEAELETWERFEKVAHVDRAEKFDLVLRPAREKAQQASGLARALGRGAVAEGLCLWLSGDWVALAPVARRATETAPRNPWGWILLGAISVHFDLDYATGVAHVRRALELEPGVGLFWGELAAALYPIDGEEPRALEAAERALALDSRVGSAHVVRGMSRVRHGDPAGALEDGNRAVDADIHNAFAWWVVGIAKRDLHDDEGAIQALVECARRRDVWAAPVIALADLCLEKHRPDDARPTLDRFFGNVLGQGAEGENETPPSARSDPGEFQVARDRYEKMGGVVRPEAVPPGAR